MTLVQSHLPLLSGNKIKVIKTAVISLGITLAIVSCAPRTTVLRSPDYKGTTPAGTDPSKGGSDDKNNTQGSAKSNTTGISKAAKAGLNRSISLVLPFQLDRVASTSINTEDVKRAALALDFYQGFQLGLEDLANRGADFYVDILDSQDDVDKNMSLAKDISVKETSLIIGPVYPKEIKAFGNNLTDENLLQVNPLAATLASEYNLPNLITLTPSIKAHTNAIASEVAKSYKTGDVIFIFNTVDSDSKQFLNGMLSAIKQIKAGVEIYSVSTLSQLEEKRSITGINHVISGTTDKLQIRNLLNNLTKQNRDSFVNFRVFGHPLWDRYDFSTYTNFSDFSPTISAESHLKSWTSRARDFKEGYIAKYGVSPSDHSFKGYDAAQFFGGMLNKVNREDLPERLQKDTYDGIFSSYKFAHSNIWGFTNEAVSLKIYSSGSFQVQ